MSYTIGRLLLVSMNCCETSTQTVFSCVERYHVCILVEYWNVSDNNCFYNGRARSYQGTKSVTDSLFTCQRWDTQTPHRHSYNGQDFPDRRLPDNFCRTTKDAARPWCYTTDRDKRWEHCNINNCSKLSMHKNINMTITKKMATATLRNCNNVTNHKTSTTVVSCQYTLNYKYQYEYH